MAAAIALSVTACGQSSGGADEETVPEVTETAAEDVFVFDDSASVDFSDGKYAFLGSDRMVNSSAKETNLELVDKEGRKAVKVTSSDNGKMYVAIGMKELLGSSAGKVKSVEFGLETSQGETFTATSGNVYMVSGDDNEIIDSWSIYLEKKNPKNISAEIPNASAVDYLVLSLEDSGAGNLEGAILYIYTISFKDEEGNAIKANTSAEYEALEPADDRSNLYGIRDYLYVEGLEGSYDEWTPSEKAVLSEELLEKMRTEGSVIEISYRSSSGNVFMGFDGDEPVLIGAEGDEGNGCAYINDSKNIAQITYEMIAEAAGNDPSKWPESFFIESDSELELFKVRIGMAGQGYDIADAIDTGSSGKKPEWKQVDITLSDEEFEMLKTPGSIIRVDYKSETGDCWIGMNGSASQGGWFRVGIGRAGYDTETSVDIDAMADGKVCYVTYDMIDTIYKRLGVDDPENWATHIFVESNSPFEVYAVFVGKEVDITPDNGQTD